MTRTVLVPGYINNGHTDPIYISTLELARREGLTIDNVSVVKFDGTVKPGDKFIFANELHGKDSK